MNCEGGQIATLQVNNTDCACVSIASIAWNLAGNQFTITLDNGQSITSPVLIGAAGATITPQFRASGALLQYSVDNGTTWVNLYDLSLIFDGVLHSDYTNSATTGTTLQVLKSYNLAANQLAQNGDEVVLETQYSFPNPASPSAQSASIYVNGGIIALAIITANNHFRVKMKTSIVRTGAAQLSVQTDVFYISGTQEVLRHITTALINIGGVNFAANIPLEVQGDSAATGDVVSNFLEVKFFKKK